MDPVVEQGKCLYNARSPELPPAKAELVERQDGSASVSGLRAKPMTCTVEKGGRICGKC